MPSTSELIHRPLRVLIVEDEPRLRDLLAEVVPEMGFAAKAVRSAEEALRAMQTDPTDILILDLQLPAMGGMELLELLRSQGAETQVIILTAFGDLATAQRAIQLDIVEFLSKPCHLRDIELALERARRRHARAFRPDNNVMDNNAMPTLPDTQDGQTPQTLADAEYRQIAAALRRHAGNKTAAASELGISRRTLHYRLAHYRSRGNNI